MNFLGISTKGWYFLLFITIVHFGTKPLIKRTVESNTGEKIEVTKVTKVNSKEVVFEDYTTYQVVMWVLKADEGFRESWYQDGPYKAIGYGYNHLGKVERKRHAAKYMSGGKISKSGANQLLVQTWSKIGVPANLCPTQKVAWILHCYNKGSVKSVVWRCCGKTFGIGCGDGIHTKRRQFEYNLWHNNLEEVKDYVEAARQKCIKQGL